MVIPGALYTVLVRLSSAVGADRKTQTSIHSVALPQLFNFTITLENAQTKSEKIVVSVVLKCYVLKGKKREQNYKKAVLFRENLKGQKLEGTKL